jgi:general secretion pathway protein C
MLLESQSTVMRSARVVPHKEGDAIVGLKLFGIRRGSPIAVLGFNNGDSVRTVNGYELSDPEKALEAYSKLKDATQIDVAIVRDGKPLTLRYRLTK